MAKLLFSDIDGTLLNSNRRVTSKTRSAIQKRIVKGDVFIPVSARMPQAIMTAVGQIMKSCPMIAYNGALVLDEYGRPLNSKFMSAQEAASICTYVEQKNNGTAWNVYSGYDWYYSPSNNSDLVKKEETIVEVAATASSIAKVGQLKGVHKVLIMGEPKEIDNELVELSQLHPDLVLVKSSPNLLEIMVKGVSKGLGVKVMAQALDVAKADCWAFGDNYNDEAMLQAVANPILMGNAPADLKAKFTATTLDNDHDGIAAILDGLN